MWLKNTSGKSDSMLSFAAIGFAFVLLKVLLAGLTVSLAGHNVDFGTIDGPTIAAILGPTLGAYCARRYTDRKYGGDPLPDSENAPKSGKDA